MNEILEKMSQVKILDKHGIKYLFYFLIGLYVVLILLIILGLFDIDFLLNFEKLAQIQSLITSFGIVVLFLILLLLSYESNVKIEATNDEERVLIAIDKLQENGTKEKILEYIKENYDGKGIDNNIFNKLKTTTAKTIGNIRSKNNLGPLIELKNGKYYLTKDGENYISRKL